MNFWTNYVDRGLSLVPQLFRKTVMSALITAAADEVQLAEAVARSLYFGALLDHAEGVMLDRIGVVLNVSRGGLDDEAYRTVLRAFRQANASAGTRGDIIETVKIITGSARVIVRESWPTGISLMLDRAALGPEPYRLLWILLDRVVGSGITIEDVVGPTDPDGDYFGWSDDPAASGWDSAPWVERVTP